MIPDLRPGGDFTVGAEDELMLVDEAGELLGARAVPLVRELVDSHAGPGLVVGEVYADQVEVTTPVCRGGEDVLAALTGLRRHVQATARAMSTGVHPTAALGAGSAIRYARNRRDWRLGGLPPGSD